MLAGGLGWLVPVVAAARRFAAVTAGLSSDWAPDWDTAW